MRSTRFFLTATILAIAASSPLRSQQEVVVTQRILGAGAPVVGPGQTQAPQTGTGVILGRVVDADSGAPIAGATVGLNSTANLAAASAGLGLPNAPSSALTSGQGYFVFRDLPAATFNLSVSLGGYLFATFGQRVPMGPSRSIDLTDGQRVTDIVVRMWKPAVVTGRVLDEANEPVVGANVGVVRREPNNRLSMMTSTTTDDRGIYRIGGLVPGEFTVVVPLAYGSLPGALAEQMRAPGSTLRTELMQGAVGAAATFGPLMSGGGMSVGDTQMMVVGAGSAGTALPPTVVDDRVTAYPTTYYPSASTAATATFFRLASGVERGAVDIQVRPTQMFRVSGLVEGPTGPMRNIVLRLLPVSAASLTSDLMLDAATTASAADGTFTFLGVTPGQYNVRVLQIPRAPTPAMSTMINLDGGGVVMFAEGGPMQQAPTEPTLWASMPVEVGRRDVTGLVVTVRNGARLRGQVAFVGAAVPPREQWARLAISLTPSSDRQTSQPQPVGVDQEMRFTTAEYPAGRYLVGVTGLPPGWTATEVRVNEVNALSDAVTIGSSDINDVAITIANGVTRLTGTVRTNSGTDPNAIVIAFPADHRVWIDAGMSSRRTRTAAVRPNGMYKLTGLTPGTYSIVAVSATAGIDAREPATVEALAKVATRVTVAIGQASGPTLAVSAIR